MSTSTKKSDGIYINGSFDEPVPKRSNKFEQNNVLLLEKIDFLSRRIKELSKSPDKSQATGSDLHASVGSAG
jgi:hypothetical protein